MSVELFAPVVEASVFTLGCMGLHTLRRHADRLTPILAITAAMLAIALLVSFASLDGSSLAQDPSSVLFVWAMIG